MSCALLRSLPRSWERLTLTCVSWSKKEDWLNAHAQAFEFLGGVPEVVVHDNLKSGVKKTHRYEPDINPSYQHLASHYGIAVVPARPYKPKEKSKAEAGVQIVERWIMARLRHQEFFTLSSLKVPIRVLLEDLNHRPLQKLPSCQRSQFELLDKPVLRSLPALQCTHVKQAREHIDYHVEYAKHYYSVPHHLVKQTMEIQACRS
jgi:hypothetical protein